MKPVLYFHASNDRSGSTRVLADLIAARGVPATVVAADRSGGGFLDDIPGVKVINNYVRPTVFGHRIPVLSEAIYRIWSLILAFIVGAGYESFYINTIVPGYAALAGRLMGKNIIWHLHEFYSRKPSWVRRSEKQLRKTVCHRIFVSEYLRGCYEPNGSTEEVRPNRLGRSFLEKVKDVPPENRDRRTILMASRLSENKGVKTFRRLAEMMPSYHFILVSSCPESLQRAYFESVPGNLELVADPEDIASWYERASLVMNLTIPSMIVETFGMTLIEAFAYGIPVIAPAAGGPLEIVSDGEDGYLTDVTDLEKLSGLVHSILDDPQTYKDFAAKALEKSRKYYE